MPRTHRTKPGGASHDIEMTNHGTGGADSDERPIPSYGAPAAASAPTTSTRTRSSMATLLCGMQRPPYSDLARVRIAYISLLAKLLSIIAGIATPMTIVVNASDEVLFPLQRYAAIQGLDSTCTHSSISKDEANPYLVGAHPTIYGFLGLALCIVIVALCAGLTRVFNEPLGLRNKSLLEAFLLTTLTLAIIFFAQGTMALDTCNGLCFNFLKDAIENAVEIGRVCNNYISSEGGPGHGWSGYQWALEQLYVSDFSMTQDQYNDALAWGGRWNPSGDCLADNLPRSLKDWLSHFNSARVAAPIILCNVIPTMITALNHYLTKPAQQPLADQEVRSAAAAMRSPRAAGLFTDTDTTTAGYRVVDITDSDASNDANQAASTNRLPSHTNS